MSHEVDEDQAPVKDAFASGASHPESRWVGEGGAEEEDSLRVDELDEDDRLRTDEAYEDQPLRADGMDEGIDEADEGEDEDVQPHPDFAPLAVESNGSSAESELSEPELRDSELPEYAEPEDQPEPLDQADLSEPAVLSTDAESSAPVLAETSEQAAPIPADDAEPESDRLLSAETEQGFLDRWTGIQIAFVEDPGQSVDDADKLIEEIGSTFLKAIDDKRAGLADWRSGTADTEQLRQALRHYRGFISTLLPKRP